MRVRVLGGLEVDGVDLSRLGSRKARRVLARLALARGAPVPAGVLADLVWGDAPPSHPGDQLSVLISRLRAVLGGADSVLRSAAGYVFTPQWLDLGALAELTAQARTRLDAGAPAAAAAAARAALDLLRGPLLPEEPDDASWLEADRAMVLQHATAARQIAAQAALAAGDPYTAVGLAQAALEAEPYDEGALRVVMSAHAAAGRPALALRAYASAARRLADDLGVDPAPATQALHLSLLRTGESSTVAIPRPSTRDTLAGRAAEVAALDDAYGRMLQEGPQLVVLDGEAGIGKTRLLNEFVELALARSALVLRGRGDEQAGALPMQPLLDALATHLRQLSDLVAVDELLDGVTEPTRAALASPTGPGAPGLAGPAGPGAPGLVGPAGPGLAPDDQAGLAVVFAGYDTVLARLCRRQPVVLCVDDVHWADPATRAWLHRTAAQTGMSRLGGARLLLLAAQRSGEGVALVAPDTAPATATRLTLGPLGPGDAAVALGLAPTSSRLRRLHERSGGNPLFLWELARSVGDELPLSIRDSVRERCERAGPAVAATLRAAAVLGAEVDLDLLAAVLDQPVGVLLDHLEDGVRRHLLVETSTGLCFGHDLVRAGLRASTGRARAALLHRQAARTLAARPHADPLTLAYHARLGGDRDVAGTALARAGEIAAARYDFAESTRLLDEAVALADRPDLLVRRARLRLRTADPAGAAADAVAVRERLRPEDPWYAAALEVSALVSYVERDFDRALVLAEEAGALAGDAELRAACQALAGRVRHATGDLGGAQAQFDRLDQGVPASIAPVVDQWRAFLLVHAGEPDRALRLVRGAQPTTTRVGYPYAAVTRHMVAGYARALAGEADAALRDFDRMSVAAAKESTDRFAGRDDNFRGWVLRGLGAYGEADDANARAFAAASALELAEPVAHALLDLADGRLRVGDPDGAADYMSTLDKVMAAEYLFRWRARLRGALVRGRLCLATGDPDGALACFAHVRTTAEQLRLDRYLVQTRLWSALAQHLRGAPVDPDTLAPDLAALDTVAPLESWWLTGELARTYDVDGWRRLALDRADLLARRAGAYADTVRRAATRQLERRER